MYKNEILNEIFYKKEFKNGLTAYFIHKPDYKEFISVFSTKFGSNIIEFSVDSIEYKIPTGIAHFLEHKLFSCADGIDASQKFYNLGLECNAYTSYDETTYFFSGTKNFYQGLEILLDFVQEPYFDKEEVENERGIIIQELMMYEDIPNERISLELKKNLYKNHPVRNDIGGTVEDVKRITNDDLYLCHKTFYHPSNMNLVIIGDFNYQDVFDFIEENQNKKDFGKIPSIVYKKYHEEKNVFKEESEIIMEVYYPQMCLGIKLDPLDTSKEEQLINKFYIDLILMNSFSQDTSFYNMLLRRGLINGALKYGVTVNNEYSYIYFSADTVRKDKLYNALKDKINNLPTINIPKSKFDSFKKTLIGVYINSLNSLEGIAFDFLCNIIHGINHFEFIKIFEKLNYQDLIEKRTIFKDCTMTTCVILPTTNRLV